MTSAAPPARSAGDGPPDDLPDPQFQCCVCLDLLYKPVVLACGHISCFWCVHRAMHGVQTSHCAVCRQPYNYFPGICQLLHHLLMKLEPIAYKRREKEVLEEEKRNDTYSPQFVDYTIPEKQNTASEGPNTCTDDMIDGCKRISVDDVLCSLCKELLYQPAILNCGHAYCESCLSCLAGEPLKCQVCQSPHPGGFPNVCLDLDHFIEEKFPVEYASRKERVLLKKAQCHHGESSSGTLSIDEEINRANDSHLSSNDVVPPAHVGVGCDSCGMYPIIGKRYKCKDCTEAIGFDLCESCYQTSSKLPGRFNQQHTPDHKFELDDSRLLSNVLMHRVMLEGDPQEFAPEAYVDNDDLEVDYDIGPEVEDYGEEDSGDGDEIVHVAR